uniref:hypothetical protein n=2 Tax=Burkholderia TaxID=32008 RepID=UPI00158AA614|nr:hypothetical protein [Burkholderia anthina]
MPVDQEARTQCQRHEHVGFPGREPGRGDERGREREEIELRKPHAGEELEVLIRDDAEECGRHETGAAHGSDDGPEHPEHDRDPRCVVQDRRDHLAGKRRCDDMQPVVQEQLAECLHVQDRGAGMVEPDARVVSDEQIEVFRLLDQQAVGSEVRNLDVIDVDQRPVDQQQRERKDTENQQIEQAGVFSNGILG